MILCSFDGCDKPLYAKTLCSTHYCQKLRGWKPRPIRRKAPDGIVHTSETLAQLATPSGDCLEWSMAESDYGYGITWHDGKRWAAHRLSLYLATGVNPGVGVVHHKCANRRCIKPEHLQLTTQADNAAEMLARRDYEARIEALEARVKELEGLLDIEQRCVG